MQLDIDLETRSSVDIGKCGAYKYAESPDFSILLLSYAWNQGDIETVDMANGDTIPEDIIYALMDPQVTKVAHNASFERVCLSRYLRDRGMIKGFLAPEGWHCTRVWCAYLGLPNSLKDAGHALKLDEQKMEEGRDLIRLFCTPRKDGGWAQTTGEKWALFKMYNQRDVEVEISIEKKLAAFPVPEAVWHEYWIDQEINDRGVQVDKILARNAILMDERIKCELTKKLTELTNLDNPNSVSQMKAWLKAQGLEMDSLGKKLVAEQIKTAPEPLRTVLRLRQDAARSSTKKYEAMISAACEDERARGMFQFYGGHTGRWSSKIVQLQNLPQNHLTTLDEARSLVHDGDYENLEAAYVSIPQTLSELIRTAFIPSPGHKFVVADFSAIEARVLSWLAGEQWRMKAFADGEDIYCATATRMFGVKVVKGGEHGELRQKGKQAELGCGYGGSVGALIAMGALDSGLKEDELQDLVDAWREASPRIVELWRNIEKAVMGVILTGNEASVQGLRITKEKGILFIELPSGRRLAYVSPRIGQNRFGSPSITYLGVNGTSKKWERIETFGGRLTENIVQAIARDVLCFAMQTLRDKNIVMHIHDELVMDVPEDEDENMICDLMGLTPPWAPGLILRADGGSLPYYQK